jgi:hypothetical protein
MCRMRHVRIHGVASRRGDQIVGDHEFGARHGIEGQFCLARLGGEADMAVAGSKQAATEAFTPVDRSREFDLSLKPLEAFIVLYSSQWPIDTGGADLEHISAGDRIGDVEESRYRMADFCASIDRHRLVIEPFGHYLERWPPTAGNDHPDKAETHGFERRPDHLRDAVGVNQ